jgi:DNA mismatch repair protein MutH
VVGELRVRDDLRESFPAAAAVPVFAEPGRRARSIPRRRRSYPTTRSLASGAKRPSASNVDLGELTRRAAALEGLSVTDLAASVGLPPPSVGTHGKGKLGELVERALGATGGPRACHDFPELGLELKTVPVDGTLRPRESTYVCRVSLAEAERAEWATSWARKKLQHVLFVPVIDRRLFARPVFWRPSADEERVLRADFEDLMGRIGAGDIESLDARAGEYLQLRPKARDGTVRTELWDPDGTPIATVPRGLYLRARFTARLLGG